MGVKVTFEDKALSRQVAKALKVNPQATVRAVKDCILDLAGESARRAPLESGDLRNDCHGKVNGQTVYQKQSPAAAISIPSTKVSGSVGYALPYALRQHEDLSLRHDRTDGYRRSDGSTVNMVAGGEAKYLEKPFDERKARYIERIKKVVAESFE